MPGPVLGEFFTPCLSVDIFSRVRPLPRIHGGTGLAVGWEVHERENAALAAVLIRRQDRTRRVQTCSQMPAALLDRDITIAVCRARMSGLLTRLIKTIEFHPLMR